MRFSRLEMRHMPRRNGPQERTSGFDMLRDRLPRSIALRLARAGLMPTGAQARQSEPAGVADDAGKRVDPSELSPGTHDR